VGLPLSVLHHGRLYATNRAYNISYDDGPPPDEQADELANAAGKISTEIGVVPDENGDGTSADAPASPLAETARVYADRLPPAHPPYDGGRRYTRTPSRQSFLKKLRTTVRTTKTPPNPNSTLNPELRTNKQ
jgi:hypothetical protein